jgi:aldose 1-epimerase
LVEWPAELAVASSTWKEELTRNDGPNHLHGGVEGFNKKNWTATPSHRADGAPFLSLSCQSAHGEEGYPGNACVTVRLTVTHDNVFLIETEATVDQSTVCFFENSVTLLRETQ